LALDWWEMILEYEGGNLIKLTTPDLTKAIGLNGSVDKRSDEHVMSFSEKQIRLD
jgi:hypothetical protein